MAQNQKNNQKKNKLENKKKQADDLTFELDGQKYVSDYDEFDYGFLAQSLKDVDVTLVRQSEGLGYYSINLRNKDLFPHQYRDDYIQYSDNLAQGQNDDIDTMSAQLDVMAAGNIINSKSQDTKSELAGLGKLQIHAKVSKFQQSYLNALGDVNLGTGFVKLKDKRQIVYRYLISAMTRLSLPRWNEFIATLNQQASELAFVLRNIGLDHTLSYCFDEHKDRQDYKRKAIEWFDTTMRTFALVDVRGFQVKSPSYAQIIGIQANPGNFGEYFRNEFQLTPDQHAVVNGLVAVLSGNWNVGQEHWLNMDQALNYTRVTSPVSLFKTLIKDFIGFIQNKETQVDEIYTNCDFFKPSDSANSAIVVKRDDIRSTYESKLPVTTFSFLLGRTIGLMGDELSYSFTYRIKEKKKLNANY